MATLPLLGQNRAYYIPSLMGGNAAPAAGTPALGESGALRDLIASLLANFNPALGGQVIRGVDNIPTDSGSGSDFAQGAAGIAATAKDMPGVSNVNPIEALEQLGTLASGAQTAGAIGMLTGSPMATGIASIIGDMAGAGSTYYSDAARDLTTQQLNADLEAAGLEGNVDLGRYGYDPSLAAGSQIAPMITGLAGANPVVGGLVREGMMMAADPVPSTPGDLVRAGVDAVVPTGINAIISGLTGSTIGTNIKGAMTPVQESIARTPEEIARDEALGGMTAEGAPVETVVPTPVEDIPPQDEATVNALIDAMAAASEPVPTILGALGAETIARDLNFADSQSVRGPVLDTEPEPVTPPPDPSILQSFFHMFPSFAELTAGREAEPTVPPPAPPVAPVYGDSNYTVVPDLAPIEETNAIFNESAFYESSVGTSTETPSGDVGYSEDFDYSNYSFG